MPAYMKPEIPSTTQHKARLVAHTCDPNTVRIRKVVQNFKAILLSNMVILRPVLRQETVSKHKINKTKQKKPTGNYLNETGHCVANILL